MNVTVTNSSDDVDGDTTSILTLKNFPGADGSISLREAVEATNNTLGADQIVFAIPGAAPHTVTLSGADIEIADDLTITGPGLDNLLIDADSLSRIFDIDNIVVHVEISRITMTGGAILIATDRGGAIRNMTGNLVLNDLLMPGSMSPGRIQSARYWFHSGIKKS